MTHPLTDEILSQFGEPGLEGYEDKRLFFADDMRAVADWQLEQVVEFASNYTFLAFRDSGEKMAFIDRLKEAMRPNTQEES